MAESTTENLFREFYGASTFVEKRDIPKKFGFRSKRGGSKDDGYPDFFKDMGSWLIVVEAKSGEPGPKSDHAAAEADVRSYMTTNAVPNTDIVGIAVSGQTEDSLRVTHFFRKAGTEEIEELDDPRSLVSLGALTKHYEPRPMETHCRMPSCGGSLCNSTSGSTRTLEYVTQSARCFSRR